MLCPLNKKIRTRLKCTVVYIPRYRKNSCVINVFGISGIECKIVYNNLEVIRTRYCALRSASCHCSRRYRVSFWQTECLRSFRRSSDHAIICSGTPLLNSTPLLSNLLNKTLWSLRSNALRNSTDKIQTMFSEQSGATNISCITFNKACVVDRLWDWLMSVWVSLKSLKNSQTNTQQF